LPSPTFSLLTGQWLDFHQLADYHASRTTKIAVMVFGLFHGFGLATKLQDFSLPQAELWKNLLAFNVGVEIGQFVALLFILIALDFWRRHRSFYSFSTATNTLLMTGGLILFGYQMTGYIINA
jgi:hypothetical protein